MSKTIKPQNAPPPTSPEVRVKVDDESYTPPSAVVLEPGYVAPKLHPAPAFKYYANVERWCIMRGKVIPALGKFPLVAGLNGITEGRNGVIQSADAEIAFARKKGAVWIDFDVDGKGTSYLKKPRGTNGVFLSKWEKCYPGSSQIDCDEGPYVEWCQSLVSRGLIPPPPLYILERMAAELSRDIEQCAGKVDQTVVFNRLTLNLRAVNQEIEAAKLREGGAFSDEVNPDMVS